MTRKNMPKYAPPTCPYHPTASEKLAVKFVGGQIAAQIAALEAARKLASDAPNQRALWVATRWYYRAAIKAAQKQKDCPDIVMASAQPNVTEGPDEAQKYA
jgi:hypothetical protein